MNDAAGRLALALTVSAMIPSSTRAQSGDDVWVVAGASDTRGAQRVQELMARTERHLTSAGQRVLGAEAVRARVERELSSPFSAAGADLRDAISQVGEQALVHVATGEHGQARRLAAPVLRDANGHLAAIGRDPQAAVDLVNLCLFVVRSHLAERNRAQAAATAAECIRMAPGSGFRGPDPQLHPPDVRALYTELREAIDLGQGAAQLTIQLARGQDAPCTVRLNGWDMGQHRTLRAFVPPGTYDVQVECARAVPGRIRRVEAVVDRPVRVVVDPSFDAALTSNPLRLEYDSVPDDETTLRHVSRIAEAAGANEALLVTVDADGLELRRVPAPARARLAAAASDAQMAQAVDAVIAGRSFESAASTVLESGTNDDAQLRDSAGSRPILGPVLLGVVGLASLGIVIGSVLVSGCVERDPSGFCTTEDQIRPIPLGIYGAAGGLAVIGALIWFIVGGGGDDETTASRTRSWTGDF